MNLLPSSLLRRLEVLGRSLRFAAATGHMGMQTSRARGGHHEFADRMPYAPGDDPRTIDWMAYARTRQAVVKRYAAEEGAHVSLLLDCSGSMSIGTPSKFEVVQQLAAGIGYLGLVSGARVRVVPSADDPAHRSLERRGRSSAAALFDDIVRCRCAGRASIAARLSQLGQARLRGAVVVLSDFLEESGLAASLKRASASGRGLALVQVLAEEELHPRFEGSYTLLSVEDERRLELRLDRQALLRYERNLNELLVQLGGWARAEGRTYVRHVSGQALWPTIQRFARGAVDPA